MDCLEVGDSNRTSENFNFLRELSLSAKRPIANLVLSLPVVVIKLELDLDPSWLGDESSDYQ